MSKYRRVCPKGCGRGVYRFSVSFFVIDEETVTSEEWRCLNCDRKTVYKQEEK